MVVEIWVGKMKVGRWGSAAGSQKRRCGLSKHEQCGELDVDRACVDAIGGGLARWACWTPERILYNQRPRLSG